MFDIFKTKRARRIQKLSDKAIKIQSTLYRIIRRICNDTDVTGDQSIIINDSDIRLIELTYFTLSFMISVYCALGKNKDDSLLDDFSEQVIKKSLRHCGKNISFSHAAQEFTQRYSEYNDLFIYMLFDETNTKDDKISANGLTALYVHLFNKVFVKDVRETDVFLRFLVDDEFSLYLFSSMDFIKNEL